MCRDLTRDFQRYRELFRPAPRDHLPEALRVFLASPGFVVVAAYRIRFWLKAQGETSGRMRFRMLLKCISPLAAWYSVWVAKIWISEWPCIGPGLYLSNQGGITIGPRKIGTNVSISHNVTIGLGRQGGVPEIGDNVWIGPDTVIFGSGKIGDGVVLKSATVVGRSVPSGCVVEGNPILIRKVGPDERGRARLGCFLGVGASSASRVVIKPRARAAPPAVHADPSLLEALRADFRRYRARQSAPASRFLTAVRTHGLHATAVYRLGRWIDTHLGSPWFLPARGLLQGVCALLRYAVGRAYGIHIDRRALVGKGLYIGHFGGVLVGRCRLGENCSIHQHVRLEEAFAGAPDSGPWIGHNVWIGPHAVIMGPIVVGDNATVAAGARVLEDVRSRYLVSGNPARPTMVNYNNAALL
jgi:serine O-acetyltransferase